MKITRRQEEFIKNLLDLYRELRGPIHYSVLAERVGVSPITAYDMLRLLEEKGMAASEYQLAEEKSGPGRTERVFRPTAQARANVLQFGEEIGEIDWEAFKQGVLERFHSGNLPDRELAEEMLARIPPDGPYPLRYCVEVMTIIGLRLRQRAGRRLLATYLGELLSEWDAESRSNLVLLGGLAFGIFAEEHSSDPEWVSELFDHVRKYQALINDMDDRLRRQVVENLREVFYPFKQLA